MFHKLYARRKSFYFVFMTPGFFYRSTSLNKFSHVALWKEKSHVDEMNVFNLPPITMLGTSTASGNFSEESKTCVIFASVLFPLFSSVA